MAQINIAGTSVVYSNPKSLDATIPDPETDLPWEPWPSAPGTTRWGGRLTYPGPSTPQPQTYDATPPTANPVLFGKQPPSLSAGGIQIPNSSTTVKNPA
jgi:hypothetical protein